jgi:FKBP-type peptidyl-prolyl cis-trans isomerase
MKVKVMKKIIFGILLFSAVLVFCSAAGIVEAAETGNRKADMSYAFGMLIAADLAEAGLEFNYDAFSRGFREMMEREQTRFTIEEAVQIINIAVITAEIEARGRNLARALAFLEENSKRPEVIVTPSGLQYELINEGAGEMPGPTDIVLVHYQGTTIDGMVFDSTYEMGWPIEIPLDRVIPGWAEGLRLMREGGSARFFIPPDLAYGERGAGAGIGPNSVLIFDVELLAIMPPYYYEEDTGYE